jgi:hypothetical protein
MPANAVDLDVARLTDASRTFVTRLSQRLPALETRARMVAQEGSEEFDLLVEVPSPTGDAHRTIGVWMERSSEPSIDFGMWHTHADLQTSSKDPIVQADSIIDLIEQIIAGHLVLLTDARGRRHGFSDLIDLRESGALLDELTSPESSGRGRVETWSGDGDRDVSLQDLELG